MNRQIKFFIWLILFITVSLPACQNKHIVEASNPKLKAYDEELSNPEHIVALNYQQTQGKRIFYNNCVWCHSDVTPAGPSNRSNLTPNPPLINDGAIFNTLSNDFLQNIITFGGEATGKSPMMPPWGNTLNKDETKAVIAYIRVVAEPSYQPSSQK